MARDLLAVISCLKWKELALCGFSMGGEIRGSSSPLYIKLCNTFRRRRPTTPLPSLPFH